MMTSSLCGGVLAADGSSGRPATLPNHKGRRHCGAKPCTKPDTQFKGLRAAPPKHGCKSRVLQHV